MNESILNGNKFTDDIVTANPSQNIYIYKSHKFIHKTTMGMESIYAQVLLLMGVRTNSNTCSDSDVISFHIYTNWLPPSSSG